jgi:hypothetical protein
MAEENGQLIQKYCNPKIPDFQIRFLLTSFTFLAGHKVVLRYDFSGDEDDIYVRNMNSTEVITEQKKLLSIF